MSMRCRRTASAFRHRRLPAKFWRRVLVLWGFTPVPFFAAFDRERRGRRGCSDSR